MPPERSISTLPSLTLADLTSPALVIMQLRSQDPAGVIQELGQAMQREKRVPDLLPFYHAALNGEYLMGSSWEAGMAFPHARAAGVQQPSFAVGRSLTPLAWGVKAPNPVRLVFLIAVPATDSSQYLSLISGLARLAKNDELVAALHNAADPVGVIEVLKQIELRISSVPNGTKSATP